MPNAQDYADWIVKNADKKGTPEFDTVAKAYTAARSAPAAATAAPDAAPSKPFGQQLNESIADIPRQVGLTARYGLQGVGGAFDAIVGNPLRTLAAPVFGNKPTANTGKAIADAVSLPSPRNANERIVGDATELAAGGLIPIAAGAGLARSAPGLVQGVGRALSAKPAQQLVSAAAAGAAGGATRESGGDTGSQVVASLAAGLAAPAAMNRLGSVAGSAIRRATSPAITQQEIDIQINQALRENGLTISELPAALKNSMRADVAAAYKISDQVTPDAVRRLADYRLTGANPTAGPLTLDPAIVTQQKNLAKLGINSKDATAQQLGRTENENNQALIEGINRLGTGGAPVEGGRRIMNALSARNDRAKSIIETQYNLARTTDGRSALLDHDAFVNRANTLLDDAMLGDVVPEGVRNALARDYSKVVRGAPGQTPAGADVGPKQQFGLPVDAAEQIKTNIAARQRASTDGSERKALGLVRQALDDAPLLEGQDIGAQSIAAFNKARGLNSSYMKIVERTPALAAVRDGIEPDKFVQNFIIGKGSKSDIADVNALYSSIKSNPDAVKAVKEQIVAHLKNKALNGAPDEVGKFSGSTYDKALQSIGDEKLVRFFPKDELDTLKAIGRVARYEQFQPVGAAVNNSNTAAAGISAIFDRIANSPLLSKIPLGSTLAAPAQNISVGIRSRQSLNVPEAIAGNRLARPSRFAPSPLIGNVQDDEEKNALAKQR